MVTTCAEAFLFENSPVDLPLAWGTMSWDPNPEKDKLKQPFIKPDVCVLVRSSNLNITGRVVKHLSYKVPSTVPSNHLSLASQRIKFTLVGFNIIVITVSVINDSFKLKHRKMALQSISVINTYSGRQCSRGRCSSWVVKTWWMKMIVLEKLSNYCVKANLGVGLMPASLSSA